MKKVLPLVFASFLILLLYRALLDVNAEKNEVKYFYGSAKTDFFRWHNQVKRQAPVNILKGLMSLISLR